MTVVVSADPGIPGQFSPKDPSGSQFYYWDFTAWLQPTEKVTSAVVTATNNQDGSDNTLAMVPSSSPPTILNNVVVRQLIAAGYTGDTYKMSAAAMTLDTATGLIQELVLSALLPIGPVFGVMQ